MIDFEPAMLDAIITIVTIGGFYSFCKLTWDLIDLIGKYKGVVKMNIFGGQPSSGSRRITCDRSDSEVEALKQKDIYQGKVKEGGGFYAGDPHAAEFFAGDPYTIKSPNTQVCHSLDSGDGLSLTSVEHPVEFEGYIPESAAEAVYVVNSESDMREVLSILLEEVFSIEDSNEDNKWISINGAYCQISCGKPREKAEVIKKYFQMLTPNFKRKDGTVYSKIVSPDEAKNIINGLIHAYPWDVPIKVESIKHSVNEKRSDEIDALKESVSDLMSVIAEINNRLDKIK
jgi:hypothetical protein